MLSFKLDEEVIKIMANDIGYSGFNPVVIFNIIMKLIDKDEGRKKSLYLLLVFGLTRGFGAKKTEEKILATTNTGGQEDLKSAFKLFRVKFGDVKRSKTTITISRLLIAFPVLVYRIHEKLQKGGFISHPGYDGALPESLRYPGSPAMMTKITWETYQESYLDFISYLHDKWNQTVSREDALKFALLSYGNPLSLEVHRL
jgi:hypothetical protein